MLKQFYTIKEFGSHEITIQKSRFIGYVKRVQNEDEALTFIAKIKKEHYNATHNCSAYIIGDHDQIQKANDDGEPSGTAGVPMLEVLKKRNLKNTAIVVTRYFGGIKLGAGGLIRAYGSTTSETINQVGIMQCDLMQEISLTIEYPLLGKIENELRQSGTIIDTINYLEKVELIVYIPMDNVDVFQTDMINLTSDEIRIELLSTKYYEVDFIHD